MTAERQEDGRCGPALVNGSPSVSALSRVAGYLSAALMTWTRRFSPEKGSVGFFKWVLP